MNSKYIYRAFILVCLISSLLPSCSENSFTKIVEVDFAEEDKQLAVVAKLNTSEDTQYILVSETLSVLESTDNFRSLSDATINITTPDEGIIQPGFDTAKSLYAITDYTFKEGLEYSIEIDHPDYAPMTAKIKVPSAPEILNLDVQLSTDSTDIPATDIIKVKFKDPANESNSYLFEGVLYSKDNDSDEMYFGEYFFEISENILEYNDEVISDITFNGKEYELALLGQRSYYIDETTPYSVEIQVRSISEELLLYENSIDQAYDSNDNPFVEPSTIYTNFDNGFGIFTIDVAQTIELKL